MTKTIAPLLVGVLLMACGASPTRQTRRATREGHLAPTKPALRYGEAPRSERLNDPLQVRLFKAAKAGAKGRDVRASAALAIAAEQLAHATGGDPADTEAIAFAASAAGLVAPVGQMLAFKAEGPDKVIADRLAPHVAGAMKAGTANRIGVGVVRNGKQLAVIVLLQARHIELGPIPRQLATNGAVHLKGKLLGGYEKPQVYLTEPGGKVRTIFTGRKGQRTVDQRARCTGKGKHQVEVMGTGKFGPTVLANLPFWCGVAPPTSRKVVIGGADTVNPDAAAKQLLGLINSTRKTQGLGTLRWHPKLARVAKQHSQDMKTNRFVGHVSPKTGGPGDRVRRAKIPVGLLMENVGVGPTVAGIHQGLMASPGHRAAILNAEATHVGIGVIRRARGKSADYFATELFASPPKPVDAVGALDRTRKAVLARVAGRRVDRSLETIAQSVAVDLARGKIKGKDANKVTTQRIRTRKLKVRALMAVMGTGPNPEKIGRDKQVGRKDLLRVGVGVAKGRRNGTPTLFTVVLLAK